MSETVAVAKANSWRTEYARKLAPCADNLVAFQIKRLSADRVCDGRGARARSRHSGGSARREHERRQQKREAATRERHPRVGWLMLKLQNAPAGETRWQTGAAGEKALAIHLAKTRPGVIVRTMT